MNLPQLASAYLASRLGLSAKHRENVLRTARHCYLTTGANGHLPNAVEITRWLQNELDQGRSPATVAHHARILSSLFHWGAEQGLCQPVRLPKIKAPPPIPQAWTIEEVTRLVQTAARLPGHVGRWPAKDWWPALILTLYWTGARIGSVLAARPSDLDFASGMLWLRKTKNGRQKPERLHPQALEAIQKIYDLKAERIFIWPKHPSKIWGAFRKIVLAAGLPWVPYKTGTYRLKRTCLTYCWAVDPAIAQRQADHANAEITRRHYVDPRIVGALARQAADVLPAPEILPSG